MDSHSSPDRSTVFRARSSPWFLAIAGAVVITGLVGSVAVSGPMALVSAAPLLSLGAVAWWLFWYPVVSVGPSAVEIRNPVTTVRVPWAALIHVDTKYALKLVTPKGSYTAWAAPAPGVRGTYAGKPEHMQNLPGTSYGPAGSVRPGDLRNTDSGLAAFHVRSEWERQVDGGLVDPDITESTPVQRRINWLPLAIIAGLLLLSVLTFALR